MSIFNLVESPDLSLFKNMTFLQKKMTFFKKRWLFSKKKITFLKKDYFSQKRWLSSKKDDFMTHKAHCGHPRRNWRLLQILYGTNLHFWNLQLKRRQWMGWKTIMKFWKKNCKNHSINLVSQKLISNSGLNSFTYTDFNSMYYFRSNFSSRFLNPNNFFPILIIIVLIYWIWETARNQLKKHSVSKIGLTFHS